jgi:transcriptional regulator with XRE-family HTH domain
MFSKRAKAVALPTDWIAASRAASGLALRHGLVCLGLARIMGRCCSVEVNYLQPLSDRKFFPTVLGIPLMKTLGDRIRVAREELGITQSELARRVGVRPQTVNQWESGAKSPSRESITEIVSATGKSATWLLYGTLEVEHNGNPQSQFGRRVPRLTIMEAVQHNALSSIRETAFTNYPCGPRAFAFDLPNDSCSPEFQKGSLWIVDPDKSPSPGDYALALHAGGKPVFGEYREEATAAGTVTIVVPCNPRWPASRSDQGGLEILAVMTESSRPSR